jgi:hypothetical protein
MSEVISGKLVVKIEMDKKEGLLGSLQKDLVSSIKANVENYFEAVEAYNSLVEEINEFLEGFPGSDFDCDCGCFDDRADWEVEFSKGS